MIKRNRIRPGPNRFETHPFGVAAIAGAGLSAAGSIAGGMMSAGAAEDAAGIQSQFSQEAINELRASLDPSLRALGDAQGWSDNFLRRLFQGGMRDTQPYQQAGQQGLSRLNQLMGLGNPTAGPRPTAPKAPKRGQFKTGAEYKKALRQYNQAKTKYDADVAAYDAADQAYHSDPEFGSLMKPYEDRFDAQIDEVAKRQYTDKYAPEILEVGRDKFDLSDFEADPGYEFRRSEGNRGIEQSAAAGGGLQSGAALKELTRFNQDTASNEFDRAHGRWTDVRDTRLGTLTGQQGFDYGVFQNQKAGELGSLVDRRNFDFGNFTGNRDFQYNSLMGQVGVGQDAVDDRNALRVGLGGQRSQNRLNTAQLEANLRQMTARDIAELLTGQGNAEAAGEVGSANAWSNGLQGAGNALLTGVGSYFGGYGGRGGDPGYTPGGRTPSGGRYAPQWYLDKYGLPR